MIMNVLRLAALITLGALLHIHDRDVPARFSRCAIAQQREHLMGVFSIFPARASAAAGEVDALYTFLLVVGVGMTALIFFFVFFLCGQVSPQESGRSGAESHPRLSASGNHLERDLPFS